MHILNCIFIPEKGGGVGSCLKVERNPEESVFFLVGPYLRHCSLHFAGSTTFLTINLYQQACQHHDHLLRLESSYCDSRRSPVSPSKTARDVASSENSVALSNRRSPVSPCKAVKDCATSENPVSLSNRRSPVSPRKTTKDSSSPENPVSLSNRRSPVSPCKATKDSTSPENSIALSNRRVPVESDCLLCYSTVPGDIRCNFSNIEERFILKKSNHNSIILKDSNVQHV